MPSDGIIENHYALMMNSPKRCENSEFGFLKTLNFPWGEAERNMEIEVIPPSSELLSQYTLLYLPTQN